jgi:hypothetical protein
MLQQNCRNCIGTASNYTSSLAIRHNLRCFRWLASLLNVAIQLMSVRLALRGSLLPRAAELC